MNVLKAVNDRLLKVFDIFMFLSSAAVCAMIVIGAFMRYILKMDFYGSEELILICAFWMYFVGSAVASYEDSHISADLLSTAVKNPKAHALLKVSTRIISIFMFFILIKWSYAYVVWSLQLMPRTSVYKIPMVVSQISLFISFVISTIYTVMHLIREIGILKAAFRGKGEKACQ